MSSEALAAEPRTGIVLAPDIQALSLIPQSFQDIMTLAGVLAKSTLIPRVLYGKPGDIAIIIATGLEFGFSPFVSLRQIYVVEGRPALSADAQLAVVLRSPACEYFRLVESTAELATYETRRKGWPEPTRLTYTIQDARDAGLAGKPNWKLNPLKMLQNRAKSTLAGAVYSDLLLGILSTEEAREEASFERAQNVTPSAPPNASGGAQVLAAVQSVEVLESPKIKAPCAPPTLFSEPAEAVSAESSPAKGSEPQSEAKTREPPSIGTLDLSYEARIKYEEVKANTTAVGLHKWRERREPELKQLDVKERQTIMALWEQRLEEVEE